MKKELDIIRKTPQNKNDHFGGSEKSVKVPKKDYKKFMTMAQASCTLQKLYEAYDKDMNHIKHN